jgi:hypothetical protein
LLACFCAAFCVFFFYCSSLFAFGSLLFVFSLCFSRLPSSFTYIFALASFFALRVGICALSRHFMFCAVFFYLFSS